MADQTVQEQALASVLACLDTLTDYTVDALAMHTELAYSVPPNLSALPDAFTKVGLALQNLRDVIVVCRDTATRGNPIGYGLPVPGPAPAPEPAEGHTIL